MKRIHTGRASGFGGGSHKGADICTGKAALLCLLTLSLLLSGCGAAKGNSSAKGTGSSVQEESRDSGSSEPVIRDIEDRSSGETLREAVDGEEGQQGGELAGEPAEEAGEESEEANSGDAEEPFDGIEIMVEPRSYLVDILGALVSAGVGDSVEELLEITETMDRSGFVTFGEAENDMTPETESHRAFLAEGFIAPGVYRFETGSDPETVLHELLASWDGLWTGEMKDRARELGYSLPQILTMASIIEYESSKDPEGSMEVKKDVSSVIHNRLDLPMGLEMDVTIFYLEEALEPYRDPGLYREYYNTYATDQLPAGPINSPSPESVEAALYPNDTEHFYFVYDREGNYYFSDDYETHLYYVDLYLN
ncbi:MAG: endolytic transglycosylase MltG [Lachnospiraceae bacterium]|nr:endolytic transglycosylase MltG [Lachnospiraceae bacterium]